MSPSFRETAMTSGRQARAKTLKRIHDLNSRPREQQIDACAAFANTTNSAESALVFVAVAAWRGCLCGRLRCTLLHVGYRLAIRGFPNTDIGIRARFSLLALTLLRCTSIRPEARGRVPSKVVTFRTSGVFADDCPGIVPMSVNHLAQIYVYH
jgi:uncharacterized membrane protein YgcG